MFQTLGGYLSMITLEPCFFLFNLATLLNYPAFNTLVYSKARHYALHYYNEDIEPNNSNNQSLMVEHNASETLKINTQILAANYIFYSSLVSCVPPIFLAYFIGFLCDKYGSFKPIFFPFIGGLCQAFVYLIMEIYSEMSISYILLGASLNGLCGGMIIEMLSLFSFITNHSTKQNRTIKFALLEAFGLSGILAGTLLSGILLKIVSLKIIFVVIICINLSSILYMCFYQIFNMKNLTYSPIKHKGETKLALFYMLAPLIKTLISKKILIIYMILNIITFVTIGEFDTMFLFVKHTLDWTPSLFGYLMAFWKFGEIVSLVLILPVLKKRDITDSTIPFLGVVSKVLGLVTLGFSKSTIMVFTARSICMLDSLPSASLRSYISKLVDIKDIGKVFAFLAITEAITSILSSLFFTKLYAFFLTYSLLGGNGTVYIVGAVILLPSLALICFMRRSEKVNLIDAQGPADEKATCEATI